MAGRRSWSTAWYRCDGRPEEEKELDRRRRESGPQGVLYPDDEIDLYAAAESPGEDVQENGTAAKGVTGMIKTLVGFGVLMFAIISKMWMASQRFDFDPSVDRFMFVPGQGHLMGLPTRGGTSSNATTGVPTNGILGFAPSANFYNFKGSIGSFLYVNTGTNASATWTNVV
jgi:hypothetical protein